MNLLLGGDARVQRSARRTSVTKEVPLMSPSCTYPTTKFRPMLGDLNVSSVTLVTPKDDRKEWYQALFVVTLEKKRILLKISTEMWHDQQLEVITHDKLRQRTMDQPTELEMDTEPMSADILISSSLPRAKA